MAKIEQGLARIEKFSKGLAKQVYCSWNAEKDPEAIKDCICRNEHIANPLKSFVVDGLWLPVC